MKKMKKMSELGISAISKLFLQQNAKISESKIKILGEYFDVVGGGPFVPATKEVTFS